MDSSTDVNVMLNSINKTRWSVQSYESNGPKHYKIAIYSEEDVYRNYLYMILTFSQIFKTKIYGCVLYTRTEY